MPVHINEANFEDLIEQALLDQGYLKRAPADYDRELCLDPELVLQFIQATQPRTWGRYLAQYPNEAAQRFIQRLARQIERRGTLYTFRHEFKDSGSISISSIPAPTPRSTPTSKSATWATSSASSASSAIVPRRIPANRSSISPSSSTACPSSLPS